MRNSNHISFKRINADKIEMNVCDNVMQCPECVYTVFKKNNILVNELVEQYSESIPLNLTKIKIQIPPSEENVKHYTFDGIEFIINNLFNSSGSVIQKDLNNDEIYLKVFYSKNEFYTIPVINIEVIIFNKICDSSLIGFSNYLNSTLINITGTKGTIERIKITHSLLLKKILETSLMIGQPPFKLEGTYKSKGFTEKQLIEMNYLLGISLIKIDNYELFAEKEPHLFSDVRAMIFQENRNNEIDDKIASSLRKISMSNDNIKIIKSETDEDYYEISKDIDDEDEKVRELVDVIFNSGTASDEDDMPF